MVSTPNGDKSVAQTRCDAPAPLDGDVRQSMSGPGSGGFEGGIAVPRIIAPSLLVPAEVVIFEMKPSLWYVAFVSLPIAGAGLALFLLSRVVLDLPESLRYWGAFFGSSIVGLRIAIALLQWLGRTYVLTDRRILTQSGVVNVAVETLGLEDIESPFVAQAAAQRLLGIGTLFFRPMPGVRCPPLSWDHISQPAKVHAEVVEQIERWRRAQSMLKRPEQREQGTGNREPEM
ncbi:MAG: PH domain-containing protein [Candidatus Hydrogenedentes bacterium]|nr:PH domain-containing protein [Candidatus Hydrogenedentota bacterium]